MPSLIGVQLIGNLGKDPETRQLPSGQKVCSISVAVGRRWMNAIKGRLVFVEGRLQTDRDEQGWNVRYLTKVIASQVQMLDRATEKVDVEADEGEEDA